MNQTSFPPEMKEQNSVRRLLLRIWKYKSHYVLVIPALVLIVIFKFNPFLDAVRLAFTDYQPFKGMAGSDWVGMDNFKTLFDHPGFRQVLANTLSIKLIYIFYSAIGALILALVLSAVQSKRLRHIFSTLFLVPYFLPSVVIGYIVIMFFSPSESPVNFGDVFVLGNTRLFQPVLIVVEVLKTIGIPVLLALAAVRSKQIALEQSADGRSGSYWHASLSPALRAVAAFMLLQLSTILSTDFELVSTLYNPLVYEVGDTLDTFHYRTGFLNAEYSMAGALWLFQFTVQLVFTLIAYLLIRTFLLKDLFSQSEEREGRTAKRPGGGNGIGIAAASLYGLLVLFMLYLFFGYPLVSGKAEGLALPDDFAMANYVLYVVLFLIAVAVSTIITLTLAYPLTVRRLPGRNLYKLFLLLMLGLGTGSIHEFLFYKELGWVNTYYPMMVLGFFPVIHVFVVKSIFNSKYADLKAKAEEEGRGELHAFFHLFIPKVWKPLAALGILQFTMLWNSYVSSFLYTMRPDLQSPVTNFLTYATRLGMGADAAPESSVILTLGLLVCLPPVALLIMFRKLLTSEVFISQIRKL
ncbi:hypothetical protein [Paenibacillus nasutitermitis]|uniref:ABC transmembrane type-1 domain-containing protein n=1 Tax=Paenibacillus nasutitermitis TaxID=1652958 RepID=A0A916YK25_9BACL|nr:hypothetical protein [Paenibacillus nasutitermitis]GGD48575.1 hypothetical protein GCM10010911_02610 [Paenibacillus nasutitermitis]